MLRIVEQQTLSHFSGRVPDDCIGVGVEGGWPIENFYAEGPLLELFRSACQSIFDDILQKSGVSLAVAEVTAGQNCFQLTQNSFALQFCLRLPTFMHTLSARHCIGIIRAVPKQFQGGLTQDASSSSSASYWPFQKTNGESLVLAWKSPVEFA